MSRLAVIVALSLSFVACKKDEAKKPTAEQKSVPVTAGTVAADGVRTVKIEAGKDGYVPETIAGKPGEKLVLVFTRTVEGECFSELKTPEGKVVPLPMNSPVEIPVTVPQTGEVAFACGMDMFRGKIVAQGT
jgi:plastocyanin domain-containing protein